MQMFNHSWLRDLNIKNKCLLKIDIVALLVQIYNVTRYTMDRTPNTLHK